MTTGQKIQALRKGRGLTQEQLAARLGVSRQAVSRWELDETLPGQLALPAVSLCYVDDIDNYEGAEFQISALNCRCRQVFYKNGGNFNEGL